MSNGLNLALVIRGDASGGKQAATEMRTAVADVGNEAQRTAAITQAANDQATASARRVTEALTGQTQAQRNLQAAVASFAGVRSPANDDAYRQRAADVAAYGVSLDNLRAKYNPLFAAELAHIRNLAEIDRALKVGALSEREHAEAVARAASAYELQRAGLDAVAGSALAAKLQLEEYSRQALAARQQQAADRAQADVNQLLGVRDPSAMAGSARASASAFLAMPEAKEGAQNVALASHEMTNLTYQMNDIAMMLASGQSPFIMMMQQGSQITQIMGKRGVGEILPALAGAITNLISPTTLLLAGITAGGYAAYAAYRMVVPEVRNLEDILERHKDLVDRLKQSYVDATDEAKRYGRESQIVLRSQARSENDELTKRLQSEAKNIYADVMGGAAQGIDLPQYLPKWAIGRAATLGPIYDAVMQLNEEAENGIPNFKEFQVQLTLIADDPSFSDGIKKKAKELRDFVDQFTDAQSKWEEVGRLRLNIGPGGLLIGGGDINQADMRAYEKYQQEENARLLQARASRDADLLGIYARSPEERAEAVRARERATRSESEGGAERSLRIETAGAMELARAYHELDEAQRQRLRSLDETLASARLDIELIGRTAGEATATQFAFEQFQQVRDEAMQNGITNEEEFQRLFGREIDLIVEATVKLKAYADAAARAKLRFDLQFEREQLGRSDVDARVADRLHSAGLSVELGSTEASLIRANELLKEQVELWKDIRQQGLDAYSDIFDLALDGFDDWEKSLGKIAKDLAKSAFDLGVKNPFLNSQFGSDLPTLDKTGGIGGWLATLLGRTANPAAGAQAIGGQNVASMDVTAAIVNINGTGNLGADLLAKLGVDKAGNDIIRMPLPDVAAKPAGETRTGIPLAEISTQGLTAKVAAQYADRFQGLFNDLEAAGYKIRSLGEGGYSFRNVAGTSNLSRHAFGEAIDINPRENPWSHVFRTDLPPNVNEIAKRNGLTWGGTWNKPDTMHFQVDRSAKLAAESLDRMSTNAIDAGRGLGALGKGMGDFGDALSKYPAAPALKGGAGGSGGGLNSLLGALFGGATGWGAAGNYLQSNPGNFIGLWEDGGPTPPGPKNKPVGIVHAGEVVWSQADVARAGGVHIVEALRLGRRGYENGGAVEGGFMLAGVGRGGNDTWSSSHYQPTAIERHYHDYAGVSVREEESDDGQGGRREDIYIEERITAAASRRGSSFNRALDARGARAPVKRR